MTTNRLTGPDQIHDRFMRATNEKDVDGLLALYDTAGIAVQLDGSEAVGEPAMRAMLDGLTSAIRRIDGSTRKLFVSGDIALSSADWTAEIVLPDGSVVTQGGTTAEVSRRQPDGTWRVVIDDPLFA
jgi:ketosteroid isomerase-like protein